MQYPTAPATSSLGVFFRTLELAGVEYVGAISNGGRFVCPVHPDSNPSLDVTLGRNGKAVFRCSPCGAIYGQEEFWKALREHGIGWKGATCEPGDVDWGDPAPSAPGGKKGAEGHVEMKLAAVHYYRWADGEKNFRIRRLEETPESYKKRGATGKRKKAPIPSRIHPKTREWHKGLNPVKDVFEERAERTPYYYEKFEEWAREGKPLVIVEGEKTADALVAAGIPATTFHGGAQCPTEADWPTRYGFARFKAVWLWADRDDAGVALMRRFEADLSAAGITPRGLYVAPELYGHAADAEDVLKAGGSPLRKDLESVTPAAWPVLSLLTSSGSTGAAVEPEAGRAVTPRAERRVVSAGPLDLVASEGLEAAIVKPYPAILDKDPRAVALELLERRFGGRRGTLRFFEDGRYGQWNSGLSHFERHSRVVMEHYLDVWLEGALEMTAEGPRPMIVTPSALDRLLDMLGTVTTVTPSGPASLKPLVGKVPFRNGVLDARTGELEPAGPMWNLWWSLPFEWTGEKESVKEWFAFLDSIGFTKDSEERALLRQVLAYILSGRSDLQKIILLKGPARAGKGTILRVIHALLGDAAVGSTLSSLKTNFGLQQVVGAGALTFDDVRFAKHADKDVVEVLLSLSANGELPVDRKHKEPISVRFNLGGRIVMASNEIPSFAGEASNALAGRMVVLEFTRSYLDNEDVELPERVLSNLPGIVRWALAGQDFEHFDEPKSGRLIRDQIADESAPVRLWVEERCEFDVNYKVVNDELYRDYARWCELNNIRVLNSVHFGRDLKTAFPEVTDGKSNGKRYKYGVRLVSG